MIFELIPDQYFGRRDLSVLTISHPSRSPSVSQGGFGPGHVQTALITRAEHLIVPLNMLNI